VGICEKGRLQGDERRYTPGQRAKKNGKGRQGKHIMGDKPSLSFTQVRSASSPGVIRLGLVD